MVELIATATSSGACCAPEQQTTCCAPDEKADCCDHDKGCACEVRGDATAPAGGVLEQIRGI